MSENICSYCRAPCDIRIESGEFTANGMFGGITGNMGDLEISDCCGESIEEVEDEET